MEITAAPADLTVGSSVELPPPAQLSAFTELIGTEGAPPGVTDVLESGVLRLSASMQATTSTATAVITGTGCTTERCGVRFIMNVPVTVHQIMPPSGPVETLSEPSPDRVSAAVEHVLTDELVITVGSPETPGTRGEAEAAAAAVGGIVVGGIEASGIYQVRWPATQDLTERTSQLEAQPGVTSVTDSTVGLYGDTSVFPVQLSFDTPAWTWPYEQVNAAAAWAKSTGSAVRVGIIDVGSVYTAHEDLHVEEVLGTYNPELHATHVAGLACAKNNAPGQQIGMVGLAWGCPLITAAVGGNLWTLRVLGEMRRMAKHGARVVNISLGMNASARPPAERYESGNCADAAFQASLGAQLGHEYAMFNQFLAGPEGQNIIWTFSAGNNCAPGTASAWGWNATLPNVITVAATNSNGTLAGFSNYGPGVKVAAPGGISIPFATQGLMSSIIENNCDPWTSYCGGYGEDAGTSMAAPIVAGIAALVQEAHPTFSADEVGACVSESAGTGGVGDATVKSTVPYGNVYKPDPSMPAFTSLPIVNAAAAVECGGPAPVEQVTAAGPTSGPAGFGMQINGPSCTYLDVDFDGVSGYVQSQYSATTTFDVVTEPTLADGQHQMSFACEKSLDGRVLWTSPGFTITITGAAISLGLQSTTVAPGEQLIYTSGPSQGTATCPSLPGVSLYLLQLYLDSPDWLSVTTDRDITMPDSATTEALTVPPGTPAGQYTAFARCYYSASGQLGIYEFDSNYGNVTITGRSSMPSTIPHHLAASLTRPAGGTRRSQTVPRPPGTPGDKLDETDRSQPADDLVLKTH